MKTTLSLLLLAASLPHAHAQAVQIESPQRTAPAKEQSHLTAPAKAKTNPDLVEKPVTYSGFFLDLFSTNRPLRLLSLRKPADPKRDGENLVLEPMTAKPSGFRLFSIDF